jgi:acetyl/propionyl-CoA carboxylase alpha subunit
MIRKLLIANRGVIATRIIRTCRRLGIGTVAVFPEDDADFPHVRLADEAVGLGSSDGPQAYLNRQRILEAARRTHADAIHPGCGFLAADPDFAVACESSDIKFIGQTSEFLRAAGGALERARSYGLSIASDASDPAARHVEFVVIADARLDTLGMFGLETSIRRNDLALLSEYPAPSLTDDERVQLGKAVANMVSGGGASNYSNAATLRFLVTPASECLFIKEEPFLSPDHTVIEAATGLDLVELQIAIAENRTVSIESETAPLHALGAALFVDHAAESESNGRPIHVWSPPAERDRVSIDAGVAEGASVPGFDPLLAEFVSADADRGVAIRKLKRALQSHWVGGITTNQQVILQILESQTFADAKTHIGLLNQLPPRESIDKHLDVQFAAAWVLFDEFKRHQQRAILPSVPPNFRNNPYRTPSAMLQVGTMELSVSWRCSSENRYLLRFGDTSIDAHVIAFRPEHLSVVLDGIMREFQFREVNDEVFAHSILGSRVIRRVPRYSRGT